jgi:hypothetical protein
VADTSDDIDIVIVFDLKILLRSGGSRWRVLAPGTGGREAGGSPPPPPRRDGPMPATSRAPIEKISAT